MPSAEEVVEEYLDAGFGVVLPLPAGKKFPPPNDTTGIDAPYATEKQAERWLKQGLYGNYAIRVPDGVLGVDYDPRKGGVLYPWLQAKMSTAPRSTSRGGDDPSGVYFFRVDSDLLPVIRDRHLAEFGTEAIRPQHRYAVVYPSIHPDTKKRYRWYAPGETTPMSGIPNIEDLPYIPREEMLAGIEAAPRKGRSASLGGSSSAPKRRFEVHELGGIKALMAGYHPYEPNPAPKMAKLRAAFEAKKIQAIVEDLEDLTASSDPWEPTVGSLALRLYSIALAPWTTLTVEEAQELVIEHGPTCDKAMQQGVHGHAGPCWGESNLRRRAERSLAQHDGAWTQLPGELRGKTAPGETAPAPAPAEDGSEEDDGFFGSEDEPPGGGGDDFFDDGDEGEEDGELIWLTRDLPLEDPPEPIASEFGFLGMFSIFSGPPGTGKSTIASRLCQDYKALWCSSEEARGTIHARALIIGNETIAVPPQVVTISDLEKIDQWLTEYPEIQLMILDNLQAFAHLGDGSYNDSVVKTAMQPLMAILMKHGVACIGLSHPPKSKASSVGGSDAWVQLARHVMLAHSVYQRPDGSFQTDRDDSLAHHVLVTVEKSNYPYRKAKLFRSSREVVPVRTESGKQVEDWLATQILEEGVIEAALRAVMGGEDSPRKRNQPAGTPDIADLTRLVTGYWMETDQAAAVAAVRVNQLVAALAKYDLIATKAAAGRLVFIGPSDELVEPPMIQLGDNSVADLMAACRVTTQAHLLWLLSDWGLEADVQGDRVIVTHPDRDETESALTDAGLGDL